MDVDAAVPRSLENRLWQDQTVSRNHEHIERDAGKLCSGGLVVERRRLKQGQSSFQRKRLHRTGDELESAPPRPIGPGQDRDNVESGVKNRRQGRCGKRWRAGEPDAQSGCQGWNRVGTELEIELEAEVGTVFGN